MAEKREVPVEKHPVTVEGFEGSLEKLANCVMAMRYDKVAEFFDHCSIALMTQAQADYERGRQKLAQKLDGASMEVGNAGSAMQGIFDFCKPYMKTELES